MSPSIAIRKMIAGHMQKLHVPDAAMNAEPPSTSEDGVHEFYKSWNVRPNLSATWSDTDGIIEFGLTERIDGEAENLLHVVIVLPPTVEETATLSIVSKSSDIENFSDYPLNESDLTPVLNALNHFSQTISEAT